MHFVIWIISGIVAGWLTGLVMKGRGYGLVGDLVLGLLGGVIGGWLFGALGFIDVSAGRLAHILVAVIGGIVCVGGVRLARRII
jgi:uncharacterized membrane protein YeaQ/YmgE (transglycosylase-associated protein family)